MPDRTDCRLCGHALSADPTQAGDYRGAPVHATCEFRERIADLERMAGELFVGAAYEFVRPMGAPRIRVAPRLTPRHAPSTIDFSELADELDTALGFERERLSA